MFQLGLRLPCHDSSAEDLALWELNSRIRRGLPKDWVKVTSRKREEGCQNPSQRHDC